MVLRKVAKPAPEGEESTGRKVAKGALLAGGILGATYLHHRALHGPVNFKKRYGEAKDTFKRAREYAKTGKMPPREAPPMRHAGPVPPRPKWAKGVKTKAEYKNKYREQAKMHHPDRGGDVRNMQNLNSEHEAFTGHPESEFHKYKEASAQFYANVRRVVEGR